MSHLYTLNLTETQKAYIAGFFDGEGCLNYYKMKSKSSKLGYTFVGVAYITNTHFETILAISNMVGFGTIRKRKTYSYSGNRKETWNLCFSPRQLKVLLREIYPYLITKKDRAKIMLDFLDTLVWGRGQGNSLTEKEITYRTNLFKVFRELNHRGVQKKLDEFGETTTIPSQATKDNGLVEGVETNGVSSNNNPRQEHPTRKGRYSPSFQETERN